VRLFRTRSVIVQAVRVTGFNWAELREFCGADRLRREYPARPGSGVVARIRCRPHDVWIPVRVGDWVERDPTGALVPVRVEHAAARYDTTGA
jgi:hypothetical protein